ncbi:RDD family protein [Streptomyces hainanensis]|uniref:RDD family protein n=1 Tax=Streptomyces hainanensis TaxID=402648 RepID=A0A4R4TM00_9ACTN|nr:RDD family protein [Streptomyces hainanensis]TDC76844.1 RDD family protein [Streptomyces hainanensis]
MALTPKKADESRLVAATFTDLLLALGVGLAVLWRTAPDPDGLVDLPAPVACALAASFVNHVLGTVLLGGSLGKLLWGLRVIMAADGRRPGFWRAAGRWLVGYAMLALMVALGNGEGVGQAYGVRTVRRRELQRFVAASS